MNLKTCVRSFAALQLSTFLSAALLIEDDFSYSPVGAQLDDQAPVWTPDNDGTGVTIVSPAFGASVSPFTQSGNSIQLTSGRNVHRDISTVSDTEYFFSYLIQPGTFTGVTGSVWKGLFFENGSGDVFVGFDENGNFISQSHTSPVDSGFDGVAGQEYFVVGKVSFTNSNRTYDVSASVYSSAASVPTTEPVTWATTDSFSYGVSQSGLTEYRFQSRGGVSQFDDARLGSSYAEVAIPEPSSLLLLGMAFAVLGHLRRHPLRG